MMEKPIRVLFADDEEAFIRDVGKDLERRGYKVVYAYNSQELRDKIEEQQFDLILLDIMMPDKYGRFSTIAGILDLKFLKQEKKLSIPVIIVSNLYERRIVSETLRLGAFDFLQKIEVAKNRGLFFKILNGAVVQSSLERNRIESKEKNIVNTAEEIEINYRLQFSVVPAGIYRVLNFGEFPNGLIKYIIKNNSDSEKKFLIKTSIDRFSDTQSTRLQLKPHKVEYVTHAPVLIFDEVSKIKDIENATITHSISYNVGERVITEILDSEKILMHPLTTIYWALENVETYRIQFLGNYIAAWVTPRSTFVEEMLRVAADNHPQDYIIGYQGPKKAATQEKIDIVRTQIESIYNALKNERKIKYVDASTISFQGENCQTMQKVRLPDESLKSASANCLDGAVLFASLIESAGMNPVIVLIPEHAFVGWEIWNKAKKYEYLETTMLSRCDFKEALAEGNRRFKKSWKKGDFKNGKAAIIDIRKARSLGIYPLFSR